MGHRWTREESFEHALAALNGGEVEPALADRKMFTIASSSSGADTVISPKGLFVLWPYRRHPFEYLPELAPCLVATLRELAPSGCVKRAFLVESEALSQFAFMRGGARWFWVTVAPGRIEIACRPALVSQEPPAAPEPLEPWHPARKVFAHFPQLRICRHCSAAREAFRILDDVLVCGACGRSDQILRNELDQALLEVAG